MFPKMQQYGIDKLSNEEKIALIEEVWDSIEEHTNVMPLTQAQREELDRRIAHLDAHPESVLTWEELKRRVRAK